MPTMRDRISNRLAELAQILRTSKSEEDRQRVAAELDRLAGTAQA